MQVVSGVGVALPVPTICVSSSAAAMTRHNIPLSGSARTSTPAGATRGLITAGRGAAGIVPRLIVVWAAIAHIAVGGGDADSAPVAGRGHVLGLPG